MRERILASGNHPIMAALAGTNDFCVINKGYRFPHIGGMTRLAIICRVDMRGRIFTRCRRSIMTGNTGLRDAGVIKRYGPGGRFMTRITGFRGWDMCHRVLANGNYPIMTALASADDFGVIYKGHRLPHIGAMTRLAVITGINVCYRVFTRCSRSIMTGNTGLRDA